MNLRRRLPFVMMLVVGLAAPSRAEEKPKEERGFFGRMLERLGM